MHRVAPVCIAVLAMVAIIACGNSDGSPSAEGAGARANGGAGAAGRDEGVAGRGGAMTTSGEAGSTSASSGGGSSISGAAGMGGDTGDGGSAGSSNTGGSGGAVITNNGPFPFKPDYILGADISWTLEDEAGGAKYADSTGTKPIEQIFVENGFNYIRLRTFVNPQAAGGYSRQGFCDAAHTITMAKRVKLCGMGILLDFHMSDTWASLGVQIVPSSWKGMAPAAMQAAAHDYVRGVLDQMVAAGVKPDMVQIGNETNSAMSGVSTSNWADFSGLVNAGIKAVRETDPSIIVWAQHGRPRPDGNFEPWVDKYMAGSPKIDEDGICGSTYGTTNNGADWTEEFGYVVSKYDKPVMSCEYTDDHRALLNGVMRGMANKLGRGSFLWEPTRYPAVNSGTLFTRSGNTYTTNAAMTEYPKLAKSYGLPVPSGTCK